MSHATAPLADSLNHLDQLRCEERSVQDQIAEILSQHLYQQSYDRLPHEQRIAVQGAAFRALRAPQVAWRTAAWQKAVAGLDDAMRGHMGRDYAQQSEERRLVLAAIGTRAVLSALISVLEVEDPFDGPGQALRVYRAAHEHERPADRCLADGSPLDHGICVRCGRDNS